MKQSNKEPSIIEQFYQDHKKKQKKIKDTKCPMANKNCKQWDLTKQKCMRGWCGI